MNKVMAGVLLLAWIASASAQPSPAADVACGALITIETHNQTTTRYALAVPDNQGKSDRIALVLLVGGGGHLDLDDKGCPRALRGNSLVRSLPLFHGAGFITALVDAPSSHPGEDGLAGFRASRQHADDLGRIIADVRRRTQAQIWLVGTSRGSISAVNAASRLSGDAAPAGIVLTSALMSGQAGAKKSWVAQTVFDLPLESIKVPVLVVGHAADNCVRSPAKLMDRITARTSAAREQVVTVTGGPGSSGPPGIGACEGRTPHGFLDQEEEVAKGIARFVRGTAY